MNNDNPFDHMFDQIEQLLKFIKEHGTTPADDAKIPPDIEQRLENLRKNVANFAKLSEDIVSLSGVSEEEMKMRLSGVSDEVPPPAQKLIDRSKAIKAEAEQMNDKLERALKHIPVKDRMLSITGDEPKEAKPMSDKEYAKKRRSKFKRFGGDKNWKPL